MNHYQSLFQRKKIPLSGKIIQLCLLLILALSCLFASMQLSSQQNELNNSLSKQRHAIQLIQHARDAGNTSLLTQQLLLEKARIHLSIIALLEQHPGVRLVALNQAEPVKKKRRIRRIRSNRRVPKKKKAKPASDPTRPWVTRLPNQQFTMHDYTLKVMGQYRQLLSFMQDFLKQHRAILLNKTEISVNQFPTASLLMKFQYFTTEAKEPSK